MSDHLGPECAEHFAKLLAYLGDLGIDYVLEPNLVRGFDYYTKTVFEFVSDKLGAQNAVGGGGRLDDLVEEIGGPANTPAIGFGLGLERLMITLDALHVDLPVDTAVTAFVAVMGDQARRAAVGLVADLRRAGIRADMDYTGRSLKAQMKLADKLGARYAVILGDEEVAAGVATVRDMSTSDQAGVPFAMLAEALA
jgi:histidyl-tRNA synthetase